MSEGNRILIRKLSSGVPGLDEVLGGGIPEYSFNLIAGVPGSGKTTLANQIMFANASPERPALYFTVLGEPPMKMLRYQQQMGFFDPEKVGRTIRFINLSEEVLKSDLGEVLDLIVKQIEETNPGIVVVDSFRTIVRTAVEAGELELQSFVQRLALYLTSWHATSFLVGEYSEPEMGTNPIFTVADGIFWLFQSTTRNSSVRKLQVLKVRGQAQLSGLHAFRISQEGLHVFPRAYRLPAETEGRAPEGRVSLGVPGLDEMVGGGIPAGDTVLVAGPSGTGKSMLSVHFAAEGARWGERAVVAVFEEQPENYIRRLKKLGFDLAAMIHEGDLEVIYLRPLDLWPDEAFQQIRHAVERIQAKRVVIDSLTGFEIALAPAYEEDFRESLYRLVKALNTIQVTVLMTVEVPETYSELNLSQLETSFMADDIILQRYVEMEGRLRNFLTVIKMRGSRHSRELRPYEITSQGIVLPDLPRAYRGIITGVPEPDAGGTPSYPGLVHQETEVLRALTELREASLESVARCTGLQDPVLRRAVDRLIDLGYAVEPEGGGNVYRPAPWALTVGATLENQTPGTDDLGGG